jgi:hypothetical protein
MELIHIARTMRGARKAERLLTDAGLDYAVVAEPYRARTLFIFPIERTGAFFYLLPEHADEGRAALRQERLQVVEIERDDDLPDQGIRSSSDR